MTSTSDGPLSFFETDWQTSAFLPDAGLTFAEALQRSARLHPQRAAFHEVTFAGRRPQARAVPFAEALERIRTATDGLAARGVAAGDRVLLCVDRPDAFLAYFVGAQALGAIPVPLPSTSDLGTVVLEKRIKSIAEDCTPRALVFSGGAGDRLRALDGIAALDADLMTNSAPSGLDRELSLPRDLAATAFIQYTSGSTGAPKGVVVTQRNLVANLRASTEAARLGPEDRSYCWLPLYHDMGLIGGLLLGVYLAIPTYVAAPRTFMVRPDSWLRAIDHFRITFSVGPNFAYHLLARRLPDSALGELDLSHWRLAFDGSEPVDRATVEAFVERFGPCGFKKSAFYPVYGLAECTLSAAFPVPGTEPHFDSVDRQRLAVEGRAEPALEGAANAISFVSVGQPVPGLRVRILEPDGEKEVGERRVGEIALSGPSVTPGYFMAGTGPTARSELRTGDLGYLAEGRLYVVDRLKDLIIIGGRNIVPSDVETVAAVEGVRASGVVAFSRRGNDGTEELVLVVALEPRARPRADEVRREIELRVHAELGVLPAEVVLVPPNAIPKTSSGKLRRAECRRLLASGALLRAPTDVADDEPFSA